MIIADLGKELRNVYKPNEKEDLPYIGLEHVVAQELHLNSLGSSLEVSSDKYLFTKGDILFGTLRPYFRKLIIAPCDGVCSTEFSVIRAKCEDDRYFLFYSLAQEKFIEYATTNSVGARPRTKWKNFSDFVIKDFDSFSRSRIGQILKNYDDLIENNRRRIELLEQSAQLLYKEWFVHLRFPGHEHVKFVDGVPEGWNRKPLSHYVTLNYGKSLTADNRIEGEYPVYGSSGIVGSHSKPLTKGPGIIVGRKGNVGSIHWSSKDFWPIDTVYFINAEECNLYLYYALQFMYFTSTDVAVPGLNRDFAYSRLLLIPSEQILSDFILEILPIRQQIEKLDEFNIKLAQARDLLLPRLMNGEIAV